MFLKSVSWNIFRNLLHHKVNNHLFFRRSLFFGGFRASSSDVKKEISNVKKEISDVEKENIEVKDSLSGLLKTLPLYGSDSSWDSLMSDVRDTENFIKKNTSTTEIKIDWDYWRKNIKHSSIVDHFKNLVDQYEQIYTKASSNHQTSNDLALKTKDMKDSIMLECNQVKKEVQDWIDEASVILWLSSKNPPLWKIPPDEWLDSDEYWQAYIERHYHFDSSKDNQSLSSDNFESDADYQQKKQQMEKNLSLFHEKSEIPVLYEYVDQPHSTSYYSLNRRVFLEHMVYYLLRTGNDYKLFPEIPPSDWVVEIERLRHEYLNAAHKRRVEKQLKSLEMNESLDLCPEDSMLNTAENFYYSLLKNESNHWNNLVARLMCDFIFLCYPAIPCGTLEDVENCIIKNSNTGCFYSLGDDVSYLFYIPSNADIPTSIDTNIELPKPSAAVTKWSAHCIKNDLHVNPGYIHILYMISSILEKHGQYWFTAPNESLISAFKRKLSPEDSHYDIFMQYIEEFENKWSNAVKLNPNEARKFIHQLEAKRKTENILYDTYFQMDPKAKSQEVDSKDFLNTFHKLVNSPQNTPS